VGRQLGRVRAGPMVSMLVGVTHGCHRQWSSLRISRQFNQDTTAARLRFRHWGMLPRRQFSAARASPSMHPPAGEAVPGCASWCGRSVAAVPGCAPWCGRSVAAVPGCAPWCGRSVAVRPGCIPWCGRSAAVRPGCIPWCGRSAAVRPGCIPWCGRSAAVRPGCIPWCGRSAAVRPGCAPWWRGSRFLGLLSRDRALRCFHQIRASDPPVLSADALDPP
jgi:hypothetical protein